MWRERFGVAVAHGLGHVMSENALRVADGGNDAGNDVIKKIERGFRSERAVVGFRPQACTGDGIDKLNGNTDLCSRLAQAAFHHVARAEFFADRAYVSRFTRVFCSGSPGD